MATNNAGKNPAPEINTSKAPVASSPVKRVEINPHANAKRPSHPGSVNSRKSGTKSQY